MNKIYRLVWDADRHAWTVAPENARGHGKGSGTRGRRAIQVMVAAAGLSFGGLAAPVLAAPSATALPTGGQVTAGSGSINQAGNTLSVNQQSPNLSLNWTSFDIGSQGTVNFVQPGSSSIAVNRIGGNSGSQIYGHLNANGQVYLINPNGVLFGQGAQVNVGGLVASTLDVSDSDLGSGKLSFSGNGTGSVINQGTITAKGGLVALLGNKVINEGVINAQLGSVVLAGGSAVTLTFSGDQLLGVQVDKSTLDNLAQNGQLIQADGGQVWMTAGARDSLLASAVNNTGTVRAQTVDNQDGHITLLSGMSAGTTTVSGTLDASAPNGGNGGFIETSGHTANIADGTVVTTAAAQGNAGTWLIDPTNFTISTGSAVPTTSGIGAATLESELNGGNVTITTSSISTNGQLGDINVNAEVNWSRNTLTLNALNNINVNAAMNATGTAGLALNYGGNGGVLGTVPLAGSDLNAYAPINLTKTNKLSINGQTYTIITSLGAQGSTTGTDLQGITNSGYYALGANIDASATAGWTGGFTPLGTKNGNGTNAFSGVFDGLGHTISNLTISLSNTTKGNSNSYVGLFGTVAKGSTVQNVGLIGGSVSGYSNVGDLVGLNLGSVNNAYATGSVLGNNEVGGLVGSSSGSITNAFAAGAVTGNTDVGGLLGSNSNTKTGIGSIVNAYATGAVNGNGSGSTNLGGLVGQNGGTINNTYATGKVTAGSSGSLNLGGLIGLNGSTTPITNSYWDTTTDTTAGITGVGSGLSTGVTGMSTATLLSALPSGLLSSVWGNANNETTPYLLGLANNQVINTDDSTALTAAPVYYTAIQNATQLQSMSYPVAAVGGLSGHFMLVNNIDATDTANWINGVGFVPIGSGATPFSGVFDGAGRVISNLMVNTTGNYAGLFGINNGTIETVGLIGGSVTGTTYAGDLAGQNGGSISDAFATGAVAGRNEVGGLVGYNVAGGTLNRVYATGAVSSTGTSFDEGGLVGVNYGSVSYAYATGAVTGSVSAVIGGLVGYNNGIIYSTYATGAVSNGGVTGGLAGTNMGSVVGSYWDITTTGQTTTAGIAIGLSTQDWLTKGPIATQTNSWASGGVWVQGYPYPVLNTLPYIVATGFNATSTYGSSAANVTSYSTAATIPPNWVGYAAAIVNGTPTWFSSSAANAGQGNLGGSGLSATGYQVTYMGGETIAPTQLSVSLGSTVTKTYDGTTTAVLPSGNYVLYGLQNGDSIIVSTVSTGAYNSPNVVSANTVSATLSSGDFTAVGSTQLSNYVLPTAVTGAGTITPATLTASLTGTITKTYDGTTAATLSTGNYVLSGLVSGESLSVTQSAGTYNSPNVASASTVTASLSTGNFTAGGSTLLSNYSLPTSATGVGSITPAALSVGLNGTGTVTKPYDGTASASLSSSNYVLSGVASTDSISLTTLPTVGTYNSPNVASASTVTAVLSSGDFVLGPNTLLSNYTLPTSATGTGTITPLTLTAALTGTITKPYDGTTTATLTSGNYQLSGFISGEGAVVNQTSGTYNSADVVTASSVTANLASSNFATIGSTLLSNYVLPTSASGAASITPLVLSAGLTGLVAKPYDGTTTATLSSGNYVLSGFISGEGATVNQTSGTYNSADVATANSVTANLASSNFTGNSGTLLSNYVLPTSATGADTITPLALTAALTGTITKPYDGTTTATLAPSNYALSGFISGESASVNQTSGTYNSADVATANSVTANLASSNFAAGAGTLLSNYVLPTSATGAATITPLTLSAGLTGLVAKPYDGTTTATLTSSNYVLSGFISGQGATVNQTSGTYNSADVATANSVTANLASSNFTGNTGTLLSNYVLPTSATGADTITPLALTAALTGTITKPYDGTTTATLTPSNYALSGFISGEGASVNQTSGTYNSADVATANSVTANLASSNFTGNTGTLLSNYVLPTSATGAGTITPLTLSAALTGLVAKPYDGTTTATLTPSNYVLSGFITGQGATVNQTTGTYNSADVATANSVTANLASSNFNANSGTLLSNYVLPTSATGADTITPLALTAALTGSITKPYDGTTTATLAPSNYALGGFISGQGATVNQTTGTYNSADVATASSVTASLASSNFTGNTGTLLSNYVLPTSATGAGTITPLTLSAALTGLVAKPYDGTTTATLTPGNYVLSGFISGQGASVNQTTGTYNSADVATANSVTANLASGNFNANSGTLLSNYVLPTSATGADTITPLALTAALTGTITKPYDGTTTATLTPSNYALSGFISGEGAMVNQTTGTYNSADVATANSVTANLASSNFNANTGTLLSNYVLPTSASGAASITPLTLSAGLTGLVAKPYDGTTTATLTPINYVLSGFISGQGATVNQTSGTYNSADVATANSVTANLASSNFNANSGTLLSNYVLPTSATGADTITPLALTAALTGTITKPYDGTTTATLTPSNYALNGFISGQSATVNQTSGTYNSPDVATANSVTASLASSNFNAGTGTLLSNYVLPTSASGAASITQKFLTLSGTTTAENKVYDGTTAATLTGGLLTGVVGSDNVTLNQTGTFAQSNAGNGIAVTATETLSGTSAGNYALAQQPTGLSADITPKALTVSGATAANKTYDGTTSASVSGGSLNGLIAADANSVTLNQSGSFTQSNVGTGIAVTFNDTLTGAASGNYSVTQPTGVKANITPALLTYVANPATVTVGQTPTGLSGTVTGFVNGETLQTATTGTLTWSIVSDSTVGTGEIIGSGLTANFGNYTFTQAPGNATALTIQAAVINNIQQPPPPPVTKRVWPVEPEEVAVLQNSENTLGSNTTPINVLLTEPSPANQDLEPPTLRVVDGGVRLPNY